jgi:uncharacterized protein (DUF849 family)
VRPDITRIKACLNGARRPDEHPAVPTTAQELAVAAAGAVAAGAEALHVHPRDRAGRQSLDVDDVGAAVLAVRGACPGVPVGVTTGLWISGGDAGRRLAAVAGWAALPAAGRPDFASVNVGEAGTAELVEALRSAGIAGEAGVWSTADAQALAGAAEPWWIRILVEIFDDAPTAVASADAVLARLDALEIPGPRLLHGSDGGCWPLVAHAGRLGLPTRIGLEDTIVSPDRAPATDNADLVRQALATWTAAAVHW